MSSLLKCGAFAAPPELFTNVFIYTGDHYASRGVLIVEPKPIKPPATAAVKSAATATATATATLFRIQKTDKQNQRKGTNTRSDIATYRLNRPTDPFL